jgi:Protein of unknown function (DUF3618)
MTTPRSDTTAGGGQPGPATDPAASGDPAAIRADIERTRAELGDTVEALAAKTDVKARAQDAAHTAKVRMQDSVAETAHAVAGEAREVRRAIARRPVPAAAIAGLAAAVTAVLVILGQRSSRRRAARRARGRWGRSIRRG